MAEPVQSETRIEVREDDLPLHCPMPRTPVWCYHPRVFLDIAHAGEIRYARPAKLEGAHDRRRALPDL